MSEKEIAEMIIIQDYEVIPLLFHEKKEVILKLLMEAEMNIMDLKKSTGMNPGTIRRHLDDLLAKDLIILVRTVKTKYGQIMKFYRSIAKCFDIQISFIWP